MTAESYLRLSVIALFDIICCYCSTVTCNYILPVPFLRHYADGKSGIFILILLYFEYDGNSIAI